MRSVGPQRDQPSLPAMLLLGVALIVGSVIRLAVEAAVRVVARGKADGE